MREGHRRRYDQREHGRPHITRRDFVKRRGNAEDHLFLIVGVFAVILLVTLRLVTLRIIILVLLVLIGNRGDYRRAARWTRRRRRQVRGALRRGRALVLDLRTATVAEEAFRRQKISTTVTIHNYLITSAITLPRAVFISNPKSFAIVGAMSINRAYSTCTPDLIPLPEMMNKARISTREGA